MEKMLKFYHKNGKIIPVKPRTRAQMERALRRYCRPNDLAALSYVEGSQFISQSNGNIYARFVDARCKTAAGSNFAKTLPVADYCDYIGEIGEN